MASTQELPKFSAGRARTLEVVVSLGHQTVMDRNVVPLSIIRCSFLHNLEHSQLEVFLPRPVSVDILSHRGGWFGRMALEPPHRVVRLSHVHLAIVDTRDAVDGHLAAVTSNGEYGQTSSTHEY